MSSIRVQTLSLSQGRDPFNISTDNDAENFQISLGNFSSSTKPLPLIEVNNDGNTTIHGQLKVDSEMFVNGNLTVPQEYYINGKVSTSVRDESGNKFENFYTNSQELAKILAELYNELSD